MTAYIKVTSRYDKNNITISNVSQYQFDKDMEQFNVSNGQILPITKASELILLNEIGEIGGDSSVYIRCAYDSDTITNTIRWFETKNDPICPHIINHLNILFLKCNAKSYNIDEQEIEELFC